MLILTPDNTTFNLEKLPDDLTEDIRFSVLDNSDPTEPDFYFNPLIFLESFSSPAIVLAIGNYQITMPINWSIAVGCSDVGGDIEILPLTSIHERGFEAFVYNPISSFRHSYMPIEIINVYNDVQWYFPRARQNQLITTPLIDKRNPHCAFFGSGITKSNELIDIQKLL